jgi:hypothetical protein
MRRTAMSLGLLLVFLAGACAPQAAPTQNPLDVQHTAEAAAVTMVAQTQESLPTNTAVPPTATASPTPPATLTSLPSPTVDPALASVTLPPTSSPQQQSSSPTEENCNKPLTAWKVPTASFTISNETKPLGTLVLSLYVETSLGECGYLTDLSSGPVGFYSAGAFVDGQKNFKVFGGFQIQEGQWKIVVRNDKIVALGGCYPNC